MKINIRNLVIGAIILGVTVSGISIFAASGDGSDPLITLSYINDKLKPEMKSYTDDKVNGIVASQGEKFVVVTVNEGQTFIGSGGTEFILRQGSGTVIATEKGGIANVTAGTDLGDGMDLPSNSLLIIPMDDGRGFEATDKVIIMVKGNYVIK